MGENNANKDQHFGKSTCNTLANKQIIDKEKGENTLYKASKAKQFYLNPLR